MGRCTRTVARKATVFRHCGSTSSRRGCTFACRGQARATTDAIRKRSCLWARRPRFGSRFKVLTWWCSLPTGLYASAEILQTSIRQGSAWLHSVEIAGMRLRMQPLQMSCTTKRGLFPPASLLDVFLLLCSEDSFLGRYRPSSNLSSVSTSSPPELRTIGQVFFTSPRNCIATMVRRVTASPVFGSVMTAPTCISVSVARGTQTTGAIRRRQFP
mmetsp:Transcript_7705/g.16587  ORF Transcript_7705/g.16587 Transcript_7705/m.16587 type:complete len:214 (+) Transcript_7705:1416-2057(+)